MKVVVLHVLFTLVKLSRIGKDQEACTPGVTNVNKQYRRPTFFFRIWGAMLSISLSSKSCGFLTIFFPYLTKEDKREWGGTREYYFLT
jgi:hypothetical protein